MKRDEIFRINIQNYDVILFARSQKIVSRVFIVNIEPWMSSTYIEILLCNIPLNVGGQTEFVPVKYHFSTIEVAAEKISSAFYKSDLERIQISNSVNRFSVSNYINEFQQIIGKLSP